MKTVKIQKVYKNKVDGDESVLGHMPNPESDDSTLENAQKMGLYENDNDSGDDIPGELDIAGQIQKDENSRHGS